MTNTEWERSRVYTGCMPDLHREDQKDKHPEADGISLGMSGGGCFSCLLTLPGAALMRDQAHTV